MTFLARSHLEVGPGPQPELLQARLLSASFEKSCRGDAGASEKSRIFLRSPSPQHCTAQKNMNLLRNLGVARVARHQRGGALIEYGILLGLIAVVALVATVALGGKNRDIFCEVASAVATKVLGLDPLCEEEVPPPPPPPPPPPEPATIAGAAGPACGEYNPGDEMLFTVTYDKEVFAEAAYIEIDVGGVVRQAQLASGSGSDTLTFSYTLAADDEDANGISYVDHIVHGEVLDAEGVEAEGDFSEEAPSISCAKALPPATCTADCKYVGISNGNMMKLGDDGRPVWTVKAVVSGGVEALAVDDQGYIYSGGPILQKWDSDGNLIWKTNVSTSAHYIVLTDDQKHVVVVSGLGQVFAADVDTGLGTSSYQPKISAPSSLKPRYTYDSDYPTGLAVSASNDIYVTTHYGLFAKVDFDTMQVEWETHWDNTNPAHIGGLVRTADGRLWTTHWRPVTPTQTVGPERDGAADEYLIGWTDTAGSTGPSFNVAIAGEGYMGTMAVSPSNQFAVLQSNINGFTSQKIRGYRSTSSAYQYNESTYGDIMEFVPDEDGRYWVVRDRGSYGSYLTPLRFDTGKQTTASGSYASSITFDAGVLSMAIDLADAGVDAPAP